MRVLTLTSLFPNQIEPTLGIFIYQRMSHFARRPGNQVIAVAPVRYFPGWLRWSKWSGYGRVPRREQIGNLTVYHPRYLLLPKISMPLHGWLMFVASFLLVRRLHRESKFDVIDSHFVYPDGFAAVLLGKLLSLPVIVSARGTDINLFPSLRSIRPMIRWTLQRVAGAIAVCTPLLDAMLGLGLPAEKSQVIGNGVDIERFRSVDRVVARQKLQLPQNAKIIISVGGLIHRKGYHLLIPALAQIARCYPRLKLYIIGTGPCRGELEALIEKLGLAEQVSLAGPQPNEDLHLWYSAADVSCLTSSREGWPNVILESMACGTPVVATRVWGTPEVIISPELGIMVDQTTESIASGLQAALTKQWDRKLIERHAHQRTWDVVALEVERFFQSRLNPSTKVYLQDSQ
jgi:teichuronic acid biosynthesis glycosyltransferase TuaC